MPLSAIKQMEELAKKMPEVISLSQGIPSCASDSLIRQAAIEAINSGQADAYSDVAGLFLLRQLISQKLKKQGIHYNAEEEIIVTAGALQALSAAIFALTKPGDEIIVMSPAYSYYQRIAELASLKIKTLILKQSDKWKVDIDGLENLLTKKTRLLVICSPNNPTGSILSKKDLMEIGFLAQKHNFIVISDNVYQNLYFGEGKLPNIAEESKFREHIIGVDSLSKDFALTGWRIGYLYADKKLIRKIIGAHDVLINCAPVVSQYAAIAGIKHNERIIKDSLIKYKEHRLLMGNLLEELKDHLEFQWPDGAYYFFPKIKGVNDSKKFCLNLLYEAKLSTVPGSEFGEGGEGHIRICFGKSKEKIEKGMKRLKHFFTNKT